jgi:crotonobetainyl-CoA:carnitine CoA-transferase CaiB-like acyl-CoA transferase
VYELADGTAASAAGRALADLGAEVVKVEVSSGHPVPPGGPRQVLNAAKRPVRVADEALPRWLAAALKDADCLILDREVGDLNEITASSSGLAILMFDPDLEGEAGPARILHATGQTSIDTRGGIPVAPPGHVPYYDAAMTGVFAFLSVLWSAERRDMGEGPLTIQVSTEGVELAHGRPDLTRAANEEVSGERDPFLALFLQCGDGEIAAHINRSYWSEWVQLIGRPELDEDPRFATMPDLLDNQDQAIAELEDWCGRRTRFDIEGLCQEHGLPVGAVLSPAEVAVDPQLLHRGFIGPDGRAAFLPFMLSDGRRWTAPGDTHRDAAAPTAAPTTPAAS